MPPHTQAAAKGDNEGLQNFDRAVKKLHKFTSIISEMLLLNLPPHSSAASASPVSSSDRSIS